MRWQKVKLGDILRESRTPAPSPDPDKRIRVKLNVLGVEKRPYENEIEGATKQFIRRAGQFIYGKQNFHKGAFGIIPPELEGYETSADIPSFDLRSDCLPEWVYYYFKIGDRYKELEKIARGVGSKRIHPEQIFTLEMPLPLISEQYSLIEKFKFLESKHRDLKFELNSQLELLKNLRQQILQEAIQGKLVPQDPNDEPASELLKKIKAEKDKMIKQGKLKKEKPLPPISFEEIPFEIPENWTWSRLIDICLEIVDCPHSTPKYLDNDTGFYGIDTNCINDRGEITYLRSLSEQSYVERIRRISPQEKDVVYTREGSIGNATFIPADKKICLGQRVMLLRPSSLILPEFLKYIVTERSYKDRLLSKHRGMGAKHVNVKDIVTSLVPIPPISEQDRMIAKTNHTISLCSELEQQICQNQKYTQELMQVALKEALINN